MKEKPFFTYGLLGALVLVMIGALIFVGCAVTAGTGTTRAVLKGRTQNAASVTGLGVQQVRALTWAPGSLHMNTNYPVVITTPESYAVGIYRIRFYRTLTDESPYLMANWAAAGSTPEHFNLTGSVVQMATNDQYPSAGTYTKMKPTLVYLQQTIPSREIDFSGINTFRAVVGEYGAYQRGDLLAVTGESVYWIDSASGALSSTRPASPIQVNWGMDATVEVDGHVVFEPTDVSMESFTIPSNPTGTYNFTLIFDIASCFAFNDLDSDGIFEPAGDDHGTALQLTQYGSPEWNIGPPNLIVTATTE